MTDFRTPRNTTRAMHEDPAEPLLILAEAMSSGNSAPILRQEADGQREIVNSDVIPTELMGCTEDDLTALGFVLGEPVNGDPMFRQATLPAGWKREGSDHAMWSYLLDGDGFQRCSIFYKAAFYDRSAHLSLSTVNGYVSTCLYEGTTPVVCGDWATKEAVLAALAEVRAYHLEQVEFWTGRDRPEYLAEHQQKVASCEAMHAAVSA